MSLFLLDANIFIAAYRTYYAFDIAPVFWEKLKRKAEEELVITIDRVYEELKKEDDDLKIWLKNNFSDYIKTTDDSRVFEAYSEIMEHVINNPQYKTQAKNEFSKIADSWIIAYAKAYNCIVVTNEKFSPNAKNRVLIPNICHEFQIPYIDIFELIRRLDIKFI